MAKDKPTFTNSFPTDIAYSKTVAYGNANANKNLAVSLAGGTAAGHDKVVLAANGDAIVGVLLEVRSDNTCTVLTHAEEMTIVHNGSIIAGKSVVGAGSGKVKTGGTDADAAGIVLKLNGTSDGDTCVVRLP